MHCDLSSEEAKIASKISYLKVFNPYGRLDARPEGGQLPLVIPLDIPTDPWQPPSYISLTGRPFMHCDLSSEEAKIPAKISNLKGAFFS